MKKLLLTMFAVVFSAATFAQLQRVDLGEKVNFAKSPKLMITTTDSYASVDMQQKAPKHSPATGLYYYKPYGTLYSANDDEGNGYWNTTLVLPSFRNYDFINMSNNPTSCLWYAGDDDYTEYADQYGNFAWGLYPLPVESTGAYNCPEVRNSSNTDSYIIPGRFYTMYGYKVLTTGYQDVNWLNFFDDKVSYVGSYLDNGNISGSGTYTDTQGRYGTAGTVWTSVGIIQEYPAPASPLYVDEVYITGIVRNQGKNPLNNGATLSLNIYNAETFELIETLTASADDYVFQYGADYGYDFDAGVLKFSKTIESLFGEEKEPITIDCPTLFEIFGFDNANIDFGPCMNEMMDCDGDLTNGYAVIQNPSGEQLFISFTGSVFNGALGCAFALHGFFDYCEVVDELLIGSSSIEDGYSVLQLSDDGQECHTYGKEGTNYDLGAYFIETAAPWFDDDGNENYYFDTTALPDWITGIYIDTSYWDYESLDFRNYVWFVGEQLPSDVTGRVASFHLKGRGYTDDTYAMVVQGEVDITGIESIPATAATSSASNGTYNLAGQRVTESAKGILVRDGKKFINK